jgi:ribosomal protein S18 acetylase RimI-like enzyme
MDAAVCSRPRCLPQSFRTKRGQPLRVELLDAALRGALEWMYLDFQPRNCFQGLPPIKDEACLAWVRGMVRDGVNLVAVAPDRAVVGHVAFFPINQRKCELLVVVSPAYQNVGVGTHLVRCCAEVAAEQGFGRIWLPVEATNTRARHVYRKCGFESVSTGAAREVDMVLDLAPLANSSKAAADSVARVVPKTLPVAVEGPHEPPVRPPLGASSARLRRHDG